MAKSQAGQKKLYALAALIAWVGVGTSFIITMFNVDQGSSYTPHLFGPHKPGFAGFFTRTFDWMCYFTEWANLGIAASFTLIALYGFRTTKLDAFIHSASLVMITVTIIVYYFLLASKEHPVGWNAFTNLIEHYITPLIAIVLFMATSPRKTWTLRSTLQVYWVAVAFILLTFIKGAITHTYPYGFMDVVTYGYASVLVTTLEILVFAWVLGAIFWRLNVSLPGRKLPAQQ